MSEKSRRLLEAMSQLPDGKLDEAADYVPGRNWRKTLTHAAVLTLAVGLTGSWFLSMRGCGSSGGGSAPGRSYDIYAGPCLPLTLAQADPDIIARRDLTLDFLPTTPQWRQQMPDQEVSQETLDALQGLYDHWDRGDGSRPRGTVSDLLMVDSYTLTNQSDGDKTITALYPVPSSLGNICCEQPILWVDGAEMPADLRFGSYTGPDYGTSPWTGARTAVRYPTSWEGWVMQLTGGALDAALTPFGEPEQVPVTVYRFTDPIGPGETEEAPNPSIRVSFDLDYEQTAILPMGFNGGRTDSEGGSMTLGFSIPEPGESWEECRFLVLGEPVKNLQVQGYVTGGTDEDTPTLEGCYVTMEKLDSDLYTQLEAMFRRQAQLPWMHNLPEPELSAQLLLRELQPLLDRPMDLWNTGWMELPNLFREQPRLVWQAAQVNIPAGDSVTLTAVTRREGSFNVGGGEEEIQGYEFLPAMGSVLQFAEQTAVLEDRGQVELLDQNFGFDPANGIKQVTLDLDELCYYLNVRIK